MIEEVFGGIPPGISKGILVGFFERIAEKFLTFISKETLERIPVSVGEFLRESLEEFLESPLKNCCSNYWRNS